MEYFTRARLSEFWRRAELGTELMFVLSEFDLNEDPRLRQTIRHSRVVEIIKQLVEDGADVNYRDDQFDGKISLHLLQKPKITALLIEKGADVNAVDNKGQTPLHIAVQENMYSIAATLLYYDADPSIVDQKGYTPLMYGLQCWRMTELLLNYEYDFKALTCYCSSLLTEALMHESPFIDDLIQLGATFNNLFYDSRLLIWCIDKQDSDQFSWLWDNFKYKEAWFYDTSILNYLLYRRKYDMFHHVIESSQIGEVVEMMYDDMRNKIYLIPTFTCRRLIVSKLLSAIDQGYDEKKAEQAIFVLLSYGYVPYERDALLIYEMFGYCELFELYLHLTPVIIRRSYCPLIPAVLLHPEKSPGSLVCSFLKQGDHLEELLLSAASYIYDPRLIKALEGIYDSDQDMLKILRERTMPSLLELSRNATRSAIWKSCETKTISQFYTVIENMSIAPLIKEILVFKLPLYHY